MEPDSKILTVVIPTFNRPYELTNCVARLLPQIRSTGVRLIILDNASPAPAISVIAPLLTESDSNAVTVVRHPANIGGNANILRCFEIPTTPWVWILGDDDMPSDQAIHKILDALKLHPDAAVINFNSGLLEHFGVMRTQTTISSNLQELGEKLDSFGNFLLISANVYRRGALLPWIRLGYYQIPTCGPHVSMVLAAIQAGSGSAVLHPNYILHWKNAAPDQHWNHDQVCFALPHIFSVILDAETRLQFSALNESNHPKRPLKRAWMRLLRFAVLYAHPDNKPAFVLEVFLARLRSHLLSGESVVVVGMATIVHCLYAVFSPLLRLLYLLCRPICRFNIKNIEKKAPQNPVVGMLTDDRA